MAIIATVTLFLGICAGIMAIMYVTVNFIFVPLIEYIAFCWNKARTEKIKRR